jgi:hypothetical protein
MSEHGPELSVRPASLLPPNAALTSITRIADFTGARVGSVAREEWETGDYVVCRVLDRLSRPHEIESRSGRMAEVIADDLVVGALGVRSATLEATGDWRATEDDLCMHALTRGGVLGRATSATPFSRPYLVPLVYRGHVLRDGEKTTMRDFVPALDPQPLRAPVVIVIGTSMSAGKTTSVITIVRRLVRMGLRVAGAKVTGVARYREILSMSDAGADPVADFVDAGLPSTICEPDEYRRALEHVLTRLAAAEPDVVVVECGASPLEPYNVDLAEEMLRDNVRCTVLCASDPYAVVGVAQAHAVEPDLVAGRATSTDAGIALCERLAGVRGLNLLDPETHPALDELLVDKLGL